MTAITVLSWDKPHEAGWRHVGRIGTANAWERGKVRVLIEIVDAEYPDRSGDIGPQLLISVTRRGRRPSKGDLKVAFRGFGLRNVALEEDNHYPGQARSFWLPLDPARRVDCQCKTEEETLVEPDGYTWTNPANATRAECRGCELHDLLGRPCPIHDGGE